MVDVGELSGDRVRHDFASLHIGEVSEITKPWINWNQLRKSNFFPNFWGLNPITSHSHPITILYSPLLKRLFAVFLLANYVFFGETKTSGTNCTHDQVSRFLLIHQSRNMKKNMAKPRNILKPTNQNMSQPTHVNPYAQDHW